MQQTSGINMQEIIIAKMLSLDAHVNYISLALLLIAEQNCIYDIFAYLLAVIISHSAFAFAFLPRLNGEVFAVER